MLSGSLSGGAAAMANARAKQYEASARWHAAAEAEAAGKHGVRQAQLALALQAAQAAQAQFGTVPSGTDEAVKAAMEAAKTAVASLAARAAETHRSVAKDNELVYYEKPPGTHDLS